MPQLQWTPKYFSTTIVAATVVEIVNTDLVLAVTRRALERAAK